MAPAAGAALAPPPPPTIVPPPSAQNGKYVNARRAQGAPDGSDEDDDDDIAAISRISINVGDASGSASSSSSHVRQSSIGSGARQQLNQNGASASSSKPTMSSLRSLLGVPANGSMRPPPAPAKPSGGGLAVPASTTAATAPQGIGGAPSARIGGNGLPVASETPTINKDGQQVIPSEIAPKRKKVVLGPGCSALDWARTKGEIAGQRQKMGTFGMRRITPSELKKHNTRDDAWSAFQGKVYDMTPYLRFHPGGIDELMRVAGRDGTRLFMLTHSWVNVDAMIDACCIGILVSESS